jgi:hypothetical protein
VRRARLVFVERSAPKDAGTSFQPVDPALEIELNFPIKIAPLRKSEILRASVAACITIQMYWFGVDRFDRHGDNRALAPVDH